jgi:hypothetical protein
MSHDTDNWTTPSGGDFAITDAKAYVDTITLFSQQPLPKQVFKEVRRLQDAPLISRKVPIRGRNGRLVGRNYFNSIHQPTSATMEYLTPMQGNKFVLHAVHIAFDFFVADEQQALNAQAFFGQRLRQTWRRPQDCYLELNSLYWKIDRKERRNLALYSDRPSKTAESPCCHLEVRFTGADACRRAGLSDLCALANGIDAFPLLKHQTKISRVDFGRLERAFERMARQFLPKTKKRHRRVLMNGVRKELTVRLLKAKIRQLVTRSLGGIGEIRSQELWDSPHRSLRSALVEVPWESVAPRPIWHCWR